MPVTSAVCLDASFVVKLVLPEPDSPLARATLASWLEAGNVAIGPTSLIAESCSVLRNRVHRGNLHPREGLRALAAVLDLGIELVPLDGLYQRAWRLADELHQPTLYDCYYLAVAESFGCEFWTADRALYRDCHPALPWVRLLGE